MSLWGVLGKGLDILTDIIPGGNLVQGAIEAVIPQAESFFAGGSSSSTIPTATVTSGGKSQQLPVLSGLSVPAVAAATTSAIASTSPGGLPVPWWKGPGGKLQLPWNDPNIAEQLKPYALDDAYLKPYYRAPKGFVVVRDSSNRPFALQKDIAKFFHLWRPAAKPPISATEWKHYKSNKRIEKKLTEVAKPVINEARRKARLSCQKPKRARKA